ncbi:MULTISPECIES: septation protein A [Brucella/Ochrobactrum group]|jgi:intracellular septation protein|uniref:Inner membrane-spanning protein YciB n=1 Tax=Brucella pseudintermedia TaxID=370111 RepID=A0ABY5U8A5_9HYPH|nr:MULTISPECIES: septation protein A [Brucella/Ochrobactrum group]KAB2681605.1 septation protein A [Brucella pseudintermedia]MCO7726960.1 septation protein A [Brucella intermedia]NKE76335.1 septation protein A [Ochrobactrum sp. MC-1LL]TWG96117.1 intracellular septation protein [Ochrobactrum sp. J50]UWL59559.1 septation protein A [Brucella pseudintermedia]
MEHPVFERDPSQKSEAERREVPPLLKLALELGPLLVFFFANARGESLIEHFPVLASIGAPIFLATALFMAATVIALAISWSMTRTLPIMPLVSGIVVLVFGALTLWLRNDTFIKMKPTIVNTLFGVILLGGLFFGKSLLGYVFDSAFRLDAEGWRKLTLRWGLFFIFLAVVNEVVWRNFSTDAWVSFKVWGIMPITIVFTLLQMPLIQKHSLTEDNKTA